MTSQKLVQKALFRFRVEFGLWSAWRRAWWKLHGVHIGQGTTLSRLDVNWPHQLRLGQNCRLEPDITFKFDGPWKEGPSILIGDNVFVGRDCEFNICERIEVGNDSLIASGCRFIDHNHGISLDSPMSVQPGVNAPIVIGEDVWLGVNAVVLKGVQIGNGTIVGAGAVVTKSIGPREIWAGIPAKQIGIRS